MAKVCCPSKWIAELCEALGEDPRYVRAIDLHAAVNEAVVVYVERYAKDDRRIIDVIQKVAWMETPEEGVEQDDKNSSIE